MKIKTKRYYLYYLAAISGFIIAILPLRLGLYLANLAGGIVFAVAGKERKEALNNLRSSFPEKSDSEIEEIAKKVFSNLCKNAVELINTYKLNRKNLDRWIKTEDLEKAERALSKGNGIIILASHFGNWELLSFCFTLRNHATSVIARRIYFDKYEHFINRVRRSKGVKVIYRDESPRKILKALKNNEVLGILADQDIDSVDGVFVDFFGKPAYTPKAPVALAFASGAPLVPAFVVREGNSRRLVIGDEINLVEKSNKEETIKFNTQRWSRIVESFIRKYPEQWVWMHRRWKTKPDGR
ncbi:MAG: lysophospholipid acyltransferase family protein [Candidatus Omnitrophica bacterium]|nr:lysophospholipid acyltransferase family protein [Candidatus Omnitrophota bacterium]